MARTAVLGGQPDDHRPPGGAHDARGLREGVDLLVVISLLLLIVLGIGVVGALSSPPPDE